MAKKTRKKTRAVKEQTSKGEEITSKYAQKGVQHMPTLDELRLKQTGRTWRDKETS